MSKQKAPRRVADNEALAVGTTIRGSAQKLNLVAALIRGKKAEEAMNILAFSKKAMAKDASKVLASAIANAENNHEMNRDALYVLTATADQGPSFGRMKPRARGRADVIRRRMTHVTVLLEERGAERSGA